MLAMTDNAAQAINALTEHEGHSEGGLRMAVADASEGELQLALAVSDAPETGDKVLGSETGAKVFLDEGAAEFLDDKVLDVRQDEEGQLSFAVYPQQQEEQPEG
jgi:Fe-S cluster assembly iron-binding protein IscA